MSSSATTELFVHDGLRNLARTNPAGEALVTSRRRYSWRELWQLVQSLRATLVAQGVVRKSRVAALALDPADEMILGFALGSIGAILFRYPSTASPAAVEAMTLDCLPGFLATGTDGVEKAHAFSRATGLAISALDIGSLALLSEMTGDQPGPETWLDAHVVAYNEPLAPDPFGIIATHRQQILAGFAAAGAIGIERGDRIYLGLPPDDPSWWSWVILATFQEASLVLPGADIAGCTVVVTAECDLERLRAADTVRLAVFSQPLTEEAVERFLDAWRGAGRSAPSVATVLVHPEAGPFLAIARPEDVAGSPGCLGTPLPGTEIQIVTGDGTPADEGEAGEIRIRSLFASAGYYGRPEASAELFCSDWLKTGVSAIRTDGYLRRASDVEGCQQEARRA